jgi:hypothetical protein
MRVVEIQKGSIVAKCEGRMAGNPALALMLLINPAMKEKKEQSRSVSAFLTLLFLAAGTLVFWFTTRAIKTGVAEIPGGADAIVKTDRISAPENFWVCVLIYVVAGLGCVAGFLTHARRVARRLNLQ